VERLTLATDLDVYQSVHRSVPHYLEAHQVVGNFNQAFGQHTLAVHLLHGASAISSLTDPVADRVWRPGALPGQPVVLVAPAPLRASGNDVVMTELVISEHALHHLVGDIAMGFLLHILQLDALPTLYCLPLPPYVSAPLRECLNSSCTGALHLLFAQSKILEFLWRLACYAERGVPVHQASPRAAASMPALHAYLLQLQGRTPTLKELGSKFGESPQGLNSAFVQAYGESIYSMLTNHRLNLAHAALLESSVAIKTLAARTGYSHGNHFNHAFKHKFGYTPSSLRRVQRELA